MEKRIIKIEPGVTFIIKRGLFSGTLSVMVTETTIDKVTRTVCYMDDSEAMKMRDALNEAFPT